MSQIAIDALLGEIVELHKAVDSERAARLAQVESKLKSLFEEKPAQSYTFDVVRGDNGLIKQIVMHPIE